MTHRFVVLAVVLSIFAHPVLADALPTKAEAEAAQQACDKSVAFDCVVTLALATAAESAGRSKPDVRLFLIHLIEHGDVDRAEALSQDYGSEGQFLLELSYVIEPAPARLLLERLVPPKTDAARRLATQVDLSMAYLATGDVTTAVQHLRDVYSLTGQRAAKADEMLDWLVAHKDYDTALDLFQLVKGMTNGADANAWWLGRIAFAQLLDGHVEPARATIRAVSRGTSTCDILVPFAVREATADTSQAAARLSDLAEHVIATPAVEGAVPCLTQIFDVLRSIGATEEARRIASPVADWLSASTADVQTHALWSRIVTAQNAAGQSEEAVRLAQARLERPAGPRDSTEQYILSEADFLRHLQAGKTAGADAAFEAMITAGQESLWIPEELVVDGVVAPGVYALNDDPYVIRAGAAEILLAEGEDEKALQLLIGRPSHSDDILDATLDDYRALVVLETLGARNIAFYDRIIARSESVDDKRYVTFLVARRLMEFGDPVTARKLMAGGDIWFPSGALGGAADLSDRLWLAHEQEELGLDAEAQALRQEAYETAIAISDSAERLDALFKLMSYMP